MLDSVASIRFRSIAHMPENEAAELLQQITKQPRKSQLMNERPEARMHSLKTVTPATLGPVKIPTLSITPTNRLPEVKVDTKRTENGSSKDESFIKNYARKTGPSNIKEQYTMLWYEKLALEEAVERLVMENQKKDEAIAKLRNQLNQVRGSRKQL